MGLLVQDLQEIQLLLVVQLDQIFLVALFPLVSQFFLLFLSCLDFLSHPFVQVGLQILVFLENLQDLQGLFFLVHLLVLQAQELHPFQESQIFLLVLVDQGAPKPLLNRDNLLPLAFLHFLSALADPAFQNHHLFLAFHLFLEFLATLEILLGLNSQVLPFHLQDQQDQLVQ